jgi:outer membrane protein assembly factor BamB
VEIRGKGEMKKIVIAIIVVILFLSMFVALSPKVNSQTSQDIVISSNTTLTSDLQCAGLTIEPGITLTTNGYSIICSGTVTNNGTLETGLVGNEGVVTGGNGGSFPNSYGGSGGGGGFNNGGGGTGGSTMVAGGAGGKAGVGNGPGKDGSQVYTRFNESMIPSMYANGMVNYLAGAGGGAGQQGSNTPPCGDGGSGAYGVYIQAYYIANYGSILASGQDGWDSPVGANNAGGGGGGGGVIVLATSDLLGGGLLVGNFNFAGGAGGPAHQLSGGLGGDGNLCSYVYGIKPPVEPMFWTVAFTETGLPAGTQWWINLNGTVYSSTSSSIGFAEPNGTYAYTIGASNYVASPQSGSVSVNGANARQAISFTPSTVDWWPMFHHDLTHSGYSNSTAPTTNQTLWIGRINPVGYDTWGYSSPVVSDGIVYAGSCWGGAYPCLFAFNASTGEEIWNSSAPIEVLSSPAVAYGRVYVASIFGTLYAFNALTGEVVWSYALSAGYTDWSSPVVANGIVYVGSGVGCSIIALNAATGAFLWSYHTGGPIHSSPAVASGLVFFAAGDFYVYALNAQTGEFVWRSDYGNSGYSSVAVAYGKVYIEQNPFVLALNSTNGAFIWSYYMGQGDNAYSSPAVVNGRVFVGSDNGGIYCLNATSGGWIWNYTTGPVWSSPAVAGGIVFVGSFDDNVYALNSSTGVKIWSFTTGGAVESSPAVADGTVFVDSDDGNVYAFGSPTYSVSFSESGLPQGAQWSVTFSGQTQSSTSSSITFTAATGVHLFSITPPAGYVASPSSSSITVNGTNVNQAITFKQRIHDVAVANVVPSKTDVDQGYTDNVNITIANQGSYSETFNVTLYANTTAIATQTVTLTNGNSTTITFAWNTGWFIYGNYNISANITLAPGETNNWTGPFTYGIITVTEATSGGGGGGWGPPGGHLMN